MNTTAWDIQPNAQIARRSLHDRFGGSRQGGISPSNSTPNIFLFADPEVGPEHGYVDGWKSDGHFHYTGSGQVGDQDLQRMNGAILKHVETGKTLRLFHGSSGTITYQGAFAVDKDQPYYRADAPQSGGGPTRSVVVFRLRPLDPADPASSKSQALAIDDEVSDVPIEQQHSEHHVINPSLEYTEADRREARLVLAFANYLEQNGHRAIRKCIRPKGEPKPIYTDVFCESLNLLVEAKGSVERGAIRMALGQILDYRRFLNSPRCAILLPLKPSDDIMRLARHENVLIIWEDAGEFHGLDLAPFATLRS